MAKKPTSRFFTVKRSKSVSHMLFMRGEQVASIWFDAPSKKWCVAFSAPGVPMAEFDTFAAADVHAYTHYKIS